MERYGTDKSEYYLLRICVNFYKYPTRNEKVRGKTILPKNIY